MFLEKVYASTASTTIENPLPASDVGGLFNMVINIIVGVGWGVVFVMLALGFVQYVTSRGDKAAVDSAQKWLTYSVMGGVGLLAVALLRSTISRWFISNDTPFSNIIGEF